MTILLKEGRKEDLKKKYSDKFKEYPDTLNFILGINDLIDTNHKYTDFVLKNLHPNSSTDEIESVINLVNDFHKFQQSLPKKDINQYTSFNELSIKLDPFREKQKEKELSGQVDKVYEDDKFIVVKPKTEAASCKYGSNTKWCVTSKGSGHFERYTSGRQGLYFIINKTNSTNKNYSKVAIHFDNDGYPKYWDSQDSPMSEREVAVLEYAYPEMIDAINQDNKTYFGSVTDRFLQQAFDTSGTRTAQKVNYLNSKFILESSVTGFENSDDMNGHAVGDLQISLVSNDEHKIIDSYKIYIRYKAKDNRQFDGSIGFEGTNDSSVDLGIEGWGIDSTYYIKETPLSTADGVRAHIAHRVELHVQDNPKLVQMVAGTTKVWRPDRFNYGYTFGKNKGLIKKLVDYLDQGEIGTKLDFMEFVGKLKSKVVNGKKLYAHSRSNDYYPSSQFRGQFSSFFASAKMAGILGYRKIGKDYFLVKGPNFDAFKSGELKAL